MFMLHSKTKGSIREMATEAPKKDATVLNQIKRISSQGNYQSTSAWWKPKAEESSWMGSVFGKKNTNAPSSSATGAAASTAGVFGSLFSTSGATSGSTAKNTATGASNGANGFQISHMITYVFAILCVLLIIILFVHFFVTPIFRLRPGTPGLIPVPGFDDGILYWSSSSTLLPNTALPIRSQSYGYSFHVDIFIENPLAFSKTARLLFHRGGVLKEKPSGETLLGILERYNVAVALTPDTNDLLVSVLNKNHGMETSILTNVPVQTPFRLSTVIMEQGMEVYLNGQLVKTRRFAAAPLDITGDIVPIPGLATLRQLKVWGRILSYSEIREATPALSTAKDFNLGSIPSSTSCTTPLSDAAQKMPSMGSLASSFSKTSKAASKAASNAASAAASSASATASDAMARVGISL
jgi:hypothetical protein